mgnify:FL=1
MSKSDNSLFIRSNSEIPTVIIMYVDDLVVGGKNLADINKVESLLSGWFEMEDMLELHYFLSIEVIRAPVGIMISQRHYLLNSTPLDWNLKLDAEFRTEECKPTQYRQLIGSLIYLTITRPDLSYSISLLSQFMQKPWIFIWIALGEYLHTLVGRWITTSCISRTLSFDSKGIDMQTWPATRPTDDRHHNSSSPLVVELSLGATKSSRQLHCRA